MESGPETSSESKGSGPYPVLALFGPTGVGKTGVAIELSILLEERLGTGSVAINCDSIQVYRGLEILSGAADALSQTRLEHRLISCLPPDEEFSAAEFATQAHREIDRVRDADVFPIVVGGTGLYLRAALSDLEMVPPPSAESVAEVESEVESGGLAELHSELPEELRAWVHPNDRKRVARFSALLRDGRNPNPSARDGGRLWTARTRLPTILFGIVVDREELKRRIDLRVEAMLEAGVEAEIEEIHRQGVSRTAGAAVGFREFGSGDPDGARRAQKALARRQLTWLRRLEGISVVDRTGRSDADVALEILDSVANWMRRQA